MQPHHGSVSDVRRRAGMKVIDRKHEEDWLEQMDTTLIFVCLTFIDLSVQAALFASFLSVFLIKLLSRLESDPMNTIQDVLIYQTQMMRNSSLGPYVLADVSPPEHTIGVNALFYAGPRVMHLAVFIMLIKSWVHECLRATTIPTREQNP